MAIDPLGLDEPAMRELAHWVADAVVDHWAGLDGAPAILSGDPQELMGVLGGPVPQEPGDPLEAMRQLVEVALAHMQHGDHPRYFARVPGPSSFAAVLGDWLATGFNAITSSWAGGSGPATVELAVIEWLRSLLGMPPGTEGVLTSGGSMSNLLGLAAARAIRGPGVAYLSDQTHASIGRALRAIGGSDVRVLPSDGALRLSVETLARAVTADRAAGRRPGFVVATAGTVNSGAVDPLGELAELCRREQLWLHVDGAYGAPAALCDAGRAALAGLEHADSLVLDPHKWLFAPYDAGCLLVREPGALEAAFAMTPEYLADVTARPGEVDFRDRTLELTRRSRALKLWLMFRVYGAKRIGGAIAGAIALAEHAERLIAADPRWELVTGAQLAIVTFAGAGSGGGGASREHAALAAALAREGHAALTSTHLRERSVLRLCTINPRTTKADVESTLARLGELAERADGRT